MPTRRNPIVVVVRATGGGAELTMTYLDDDGELPDDAARVRLKRQFEAAFAELKRRVATSVEIETRPWQIGDGGDLVSWRTVLRRLEAKGGRS